MKMVFAVCVGVLVCGMAPASWAGEVSIGVDTLIGGTKAGTCHITYFRSPGDAVKDYQKRQKERFEPADPAVVERLGQGVLVSAIVVTYNQPRCAQNSGIPQKVVFTAKGGSEPLLVISLTPEEVQLKNLAGAEFTAVNATGGVAPVELAKLKGRDLDFHLVYSDHAYVDKWRKDYVDKIMK